jgi:hypothetical protein
VTHFTVEATMAPVTADAEWAVLRDMTDLVPATILIEDSEEPVLVFPVVADSIGKAAVFVQGVVSVAKLKIVWGRAFRTQVPDFELGLPEGKANSATAPGFEPDWLNAGDEHQRFELV